MQMPSGSVRRTPRDGHLNEPLRGGANDRVLIAIFEEIKLRASMGEMRALLDFLEREGAIAISMYEEPHSDRADRRASLPDRAKFAFGQRVTWLKGCRPIEFPMGLIEALGELPRHSGSRVWLDALSSCPFVDVADGAGAPASMAFRLPPDIPNSAINASMRGPPTR